MIQSQTIEQAKEYPRSRALRGLRQIISEGDYGEGGSLPTEQVLCKRFGVSRGTLRTALGQLEEEGLVRGGSGRGKIVNVPDPRRPGPRTLMADSIAIVTHEIYQVSPTWRDTAADLSIQMSAIATIGNAKLHAMTLQPELLNGDGLRRLVAERPCGVILLRRVLETEQGPRVLAELRNARIPVVAYGNAEGLEDFDTVVSDHEAGAYELTRWLLDRGCRRILRFWQLSSAPPMAKRPEWVAQRDAGFERAMREAGLQPLPAFEHRVSPPDTSKTDRGQFEDATYLIAGQLVPYLSGSEPVDAIMAISDGVLLSVAVACRMFGKEPNRDVMLVGYDNQWPHEPRRHLEKTIPAATVDKLNHRLGEELVSLLLARAQGSLPPEAQHRTLKPRLVIPVAPEPTAAHRDL